MLVLSTPTNLMEYDWKVCRTGISKITYLQKGTNSLSHYKAAHKFIQMPPAPNIPDAKAAVEREWEKLEKILAWQLPQSETRKR